MRLGSCLQIGCSVTAGPLTSMDAGRLWWEDHFPGYTPEDLEKPINEACAEELSSRALKALLCAALGPSISLSATRRLTSGEIQVLFDRAIMDIEKAVQLNPNSIKAHTIRGKILWNRGLRTSPVLGASARRALMEEARRAMLTAEKLADKRMVSILDVTALVLIELGELDLAQDVIARGSLIDANAFRIAARFLDRARSGVEPPEEDEA